MRLPVDWQTATTGELCTSIVPGRDKPRSFSGAIAWVTLPDLTSRQVPKANHSLRLSLEEIEAVGARIVPPGAVIMSCVGEFGIVAVNSEPVVINQQLHAFVCSARVLSSFLLYCLQSKVKQMRSLASTTTIAYLNKANCESVSVLLPQLPEQERIVEALDTWDTAIQKTEQLIAAKGRHRDALIQRLYLRSDSRGRPSRFGDLLTESMEVGQNGLHAKKITVRLYGKGVLAKEEKRLGSEQTQYFIRRAGQLIYSKLDFLNGAFGIIPPELDGYESTLDLPAFDIASTVNPVWLLGYLTRPIYYTRQIGLARGQRKARRVHPSDLLASGLKVPPRGLQDRIAEILTSSQCDIDKSKRLLEALKTQKRGLMQKLLTGQWRLPAVEEVVSV